VDHGTRQVFIDAALAVAENMEHARLAGEALAIGVKQGTVIGSPIPLPTTLSIQPMLA
jgi:hypothetical protein